MSTVSGKRYAAAAAACAVILTSLYSCGCDYSAERSDEYTSSSLASAGICGTWTSADGEYTEAGFKDTAAEPLSAFSVDVDTASYANVRRLIEEGLAVPEDEVRAEDFINYFDYDYPDPDEGKIFGDYVELADCPWNPSGKLLMIGIQGRRTAPEELPPSNLVFLIDSSGSMASYDKLPLFQTAFSMLAERFTENDRISIVTYGGSTDICISGASGSDKDAILEALCSITASGGTDGEGSIEKACGLAGEYFIEGGNNRVILITDGGSADGLTKLAESGTDSGIDLSVLSFGTGGCMDDRLGAVAESGSCSSIYSVDEAVKALVREMNGTICTIARDVQIQVEFNPSMIRRYRLIGYDNRLNGAEDFRSTADNAGEVGAGQSVTALYEVELAEDEDAYRGVQLEFASGNERTLSENGRGNELCKLSLAYKPADSDRDIFESRLFGMEKYNETPSESLRLASAAAEFAMILRNSEYKGSSSLSYVISTADDVAACEKTSELSRLAREVKLLCG